MHGLSREENIKKLLTISKEANIIQARWLVIANIYKFYLTCWYDKRMDGHRTTLG